MNEVLPVIYLARHGETAWSLSGQHTGLTDLPLTERGERTARRLGERLQELTLAKVFTSPLQRAHRTCELAGLGAVAEVDRDLVEWDPWRFAAAAWALVGGILANLLLALGAAFLIGGFRHHDQRFNPAAARAYST